MVFLLEICFIDKIKKSYTTKDDAWLISLNQNTVMGPSGIVESIDFDSLNFSVEDFNQFITDLDGRIIRLFGDSIDLDLSNELKKYFYIKLYNIFRFIKAKVIDDNFTISFDKKTDVVPQFSVLAGTNKESAYSFMHDLRDSFYPLVAIIFPKESSAGFFSSGLMFKLKVRTFLLFFATVLNYLKSIFRYFKLPVSNPINLSLSQETVFVVVRNRLQKDFFESRIANNPSLSAVHFCYLYGYFDKNRTLDGYNLVKFDFACFASVVFGFLNFIFKNWVSKGSINNAIKLELYSNFEHRYFNYNIEKFIDKKIHQVKSIVSLEMTGRHSYFIQKCCKERSVILNRFQVASIAELHVSRLTFYGNFWASDESSYRILNTNFPGQVCYENDLVPVIDVIKLKVDESRILFATQPYGIDDNVLIIRLILSVLPDGFHLIIRRHPRDSFDYQSAFSEVLYDSFEDVASIYSSRLVISKTSTILQSCIFLDVPFISVQIDDYSRSVNLSFLNKCPSRVVTNASDFVDALRSEIQECHPKVRYLKIPTLNSIRSSFEAL